MFEGSWGNPLVSRKQYAVGICLKKKEKEVFVWGEMLGDRRK